MAMYWTVFGSVCCIGQCLAVCVVEDSVWQCVLYRTVFGSVCCIGQCLAVCVDGTVFGSVCCIGQCLAVCVVWASVWQCVLYRIVFGSICCVFQSGGRSHPENNSPETDEGTGKPGPGGFRRSGN